MRTTALSFIILLCLAGLSHCGNVVIGNGNCVQGENNVINHGDGNNIIGSDNALRDSFRNQILGNLNNIFKSNNLQVQGNGYNFVNDVTVPVLLGNLQAEQGGNQ